MKKWEKVKSLYNDGISIRQIAKDMELSRNTVRKWLRSKEFPSYNRTHYPTKIDEYKSQIKEWYLESGYIGARIYRELKKQGYDGSINPIYRYINKLKEEEGGLL